MPGKKFWSRLGHARREVLIVGRPLLLNKHYTGTVDIAKSQKGATGDERTFVKCK